MLGVPGSIPGRVVTRKCYQSSYISLILVFFYLSCQTTLMEHHETVKSNFKAELQEHFSQEKQTLTQQYEEGILTLRWVETHGQ